MRRWSAGVAVLIVLSAAARIGSAVWRAWRLGQAGVRAAVIDEGIQPNERFPHGERFAGTGFEVFTIDEEKVRKEARYDGKWVLRTNTDLPAAEVALNYK